MSDVKPHPKYHLELDRRGTLTLHDHELLAVWHGVVEDSDLHKSLIELVRLANLGDAISQGAEKLVGPTGRLGARDPSEQQIPRWDPGDPEDTPKPLRPRMPPPPGARRGHEPGCEAWVGYACTCQ